MEDIEYIGEHLWLGQLGHFMVLLAFVSALFSAFSYFKGRSDKSWLPLAKTGFIIHGIAVFTVIALIFTAMINHWYEYDYVYRTVSDSSPTKYLLAAFWADQEGSFLLWMFWHVILGWIFMAKGKEWATPTLITLALIQAFLTSMLLGLYMPFTSEDIKIGSNPFILVREFYDAPIFANADYLTLIEGRGLNPLLQNYWMTIHPPVLFLGFASTAIPFSMSIAGLSSKHHKELMTPLLRWSLFSAAILGLGILMGAAWAYEALTFGGYWAWDPVENTSLVPWLLIVAGVHTNLIAKSTNYSIKSTYIYYTLTFIMILYSTFLTRSGILGDTSVHAFTTMGLETQLALFILFFLGLALFKIISNNKSIPTKKDEEKIYSREFWMFVGALILFFSGFLMTSSTSLPVYNKIVELFDPNHIPIAIDDPMEHHNRYQIWIGVFMGLLSGASVLLRYSGANWSSFKPKFFKAIGTSLLIALVLTVLLSQVIKLSGWAQYTFLFAGLFTLIANAQYLLRYMRQNLKGAGAAFAHMGFGILILGILFSGMNQKTITAARFFQSDFAEGSAEDKAIVLIKNQPFFSAGYWMNYTGDTLVDNMRYYNVDFRKVDENNVTEYEFTTRPSAIYNREFSKIEALNPGNQRSFTYDIFTAASPPPYMSDHDIFVAQEDSLRYLSHMVNSGMTFEEETYIAQVGTPIFNYDFKNEDDHSDSTKYDITVGIPIKVTSKLDGTVYEIVPGLALKDAIVFQIPELVNPLRLKFKIPETAFGDIFTEEEKLNYEEIQLKQGASYQWNDYTITLESFNRSGPFKNYQAKESEIAIAGNIRIKQNISGKEFTQEPIFILRNAQQFSIKDYTPELGIHSRFANIDPQTEQMTFKLALDQRDQTGFEVLIAEDAPRDDILIVEANIFPGINLVWLGCLMMVGGLFCSFFAKRQKSLQA